MHIYIHTYGRANSQVTLGQLPASIYHRVILVIQEREKDLYARYPVEKLVLPSNIRTLSPTRQFILENHCKEFTNKKLVMMDDDLRFDKRRKDDPTKFLKATPRQIEQMFEAIEEKLEKYSHVGVLAREGGNRITKKVLECTRMMRILGYKVDTVLKEDCTFDRLPFQQDFDMTLQLLRKGYPNAVLCDWVQGQGSSNASGGCSSYRTLEKLNLNATKLAKLHAPFVKVVEKTTKGAWGGGTRMDVTVQWKKAYLSSQKVK